MAGGRGGEGGREEVAGGEVEVSVAARLGLGLSEVQVRLARVKEASRFWDSGNVKKLAPLVGWVGRSGGGEGGLGVGLKAVF